MYIFTLDKKLGTRRKVRFLYLKLDEKLPL